MIGNLKGGAIDGRFGKNPDQEKEVVSSAAGTQISYAVRCKAAKMVAKSNSRKKKGRPGGTDHAVLASRWSSKTVQTYGMEGHRRRWCG